MRCIPTVALLAAVTTLACAPQGESPPAASASLSAAAIEGSWEGTSYSVPGDSVVSTWTSVLGADGSGTLMVNGQPAPIPFSANFDADSVSFISSEYADATLPPDAPRLIFRAVGRLMSDGKLAGSSTVRAAAAPDSVISTVRWESMKQP